MTLLNLGNVCMDDVAIKSILSIFNKGSEVQLLLKKIKGSQPRPRSTHPIQTT